MFSYKYSVEQQLVAAFDNTLPDAQKYVYDDPLNASASIGIGIKCGVYMC